MKSEEMLRKAAKIKNWLYQAEAVIVGAGAGLSASAGFCYNGPRFTENFGDFIEKYGITDMYSAGFYPFASQEEKWAYWSRHILLNRYREEVGAAYKNLLSLLKGQRYFVITTNVDHQFQLAGFPEERLFAVQGDYGMFQCAKACHKALYRNEKQVHDMVREQRDCRIPASLVPKCPVCGGHMEVNLRKDSYFVEDRAWHEAAQRYEDFLQQNQRKKLLFLELGVGMNTPVIIKYPFWEMTKSFPQARYACINQDREWTPETIQDKAVCLEADIGKTLEIWKGDDVNVSGQNAG